MKKEHAEYEMARDHLRRRHGFFSVPVALGKRIGWEEAALFEHLANLGEFFRERAVFKDEVAWFYRSNEEIQFTMGLKTPEKVKRLTNKLKALSLIKTKTMGLKGSNNTVVHYTVDVAGYTSFVQGFDANESEELLSSNDESLFRRTTNRRFNDSSPSSLSSNRIKLNININEPGTSQATPSVEATTVGLETKTKAPPPLTEVENLKSLSLQERCKAVLSGQVDGLPLSTYKTCPEAILATFLQAWGMTWNKSAARLRITAKRRKAFKQAMTDGYPPSDFLKALLGMRWDEWPGRSEHNDWDIVARNLEKWRDLFDAKKGTTPPALLAPGIKTKTIKGFVVPIDYPWSHGDDHVAGQGKRTFNLEKGKWND